MQLVGQPPHGPLQGLQLLVQIGAQTFQFDRISQFLGQNFLVEIGVVDRVVRVGIRDRLRGRRLQRGLAVGQFGILAHLLIGHLVHADLRLACVLAVLLGLLGAGFGLFLLLVVLTAAIGVFLLLGAIVGVVVILVGLVGIIAQLVAVTQILDHLAREFGKSPLIGQRVLQTFQRAARLILDKAAPQLHHVLRTGRQIAACGQMADHVTRSGGQRRIRGLRDLVIARARGLMRDLGVDIASRARHVARAHRLATGGFHRLVKLAGHLARRGVARM